jgi:hypothetical protein
LRQYLEIYVIVVCILSAFAQFALWRRFNSVPGADAHSNAARATRAAGWIVVLALLATWPWAAHRYDVAIYVVFGVVWLYLTSFLLWFFFAATDTSMHVHLLVETVGREPLTRSELRNHYGKANIIASRVPRLLALGQLTNADGRLRLTGKAVLRGAWIAATARRILGLPTRPPREAEPVLPAARGPSRSIGAAWPRIPHAPFASLAVWLYFYLPRAWSFGFYNGDWWDLLVPRTWDYIGITFWYRPISIPFVYWLPSLVGYRPWVWQSMLAICMLISAYLIYRAFARLRALVLGVGEGRSYLLAPDLSAAAFLLFPWTFGWSAWPTILGMGTIGLIFFLASLFWLFAPHPTRHAMWFSVLFYTLATLSYEAFYFAFVPLTLIMAGVCFARRSIPAPYWIPFLGFPTVQLLAIAYGRLFPLLVPGIDLRQLKPINWQLIDELRHHMVMLPGNLLHSAPNAVELLQISQAMALALVAAVMLPLLRSRVRRLGLVMLAVIVACLGAVVIAVFVYNIAAYGLIGTGTMSRTTLSVSFWICMLIYVFLFCAEVSRPHWLLQPAAVAAVVVLVVGFVPGFNKQHREWQESWENSVRILSRMPVDRIAKLPPEAVVVYVGPTDIGSLQSVETLSLMGWSLYFHPETAIPNKVIKARNLDTRYYSFLTYRHGELLHGRTFVSKSDYHKLDWDGKELHFSLPGHWKTEIPARRVYEWDQYRSTFREMAPFQPFGEPG